MNVCINCKYCTGPKERPLMTCNHADCAEPIMGEPQPCHFLRERNQVCGPSGLLFVNRDSEVLQGSTEAQQAATGSEVKG